VVFLRLAFTARNTALRIGASLSGSDRTLQVGGRPGMKFQMRPNVSSVRLHSCRVYTTGDTLHLQSNNSTEKHSYLAHNLQMPRWRRLMTSDGFYIYSNQPILLVVDNAAVCKCTCPVVHYHYSNCTSRWLAMLTTRKASHMHRCIACP
jgi:hypothetical protein